MATFIDGDGQTEDSSGATVAITLAGITSSALVWGMLKWEGAVTTLTSVSDGTSSFTADALGVVSNGNGDLHSTMFYLLASVATGSVTYTATIGANRTFKQMVVAAFSYSGTAARDSANQAQGNSTSPNSGNISPTGSELVVLGARGNYFSGASLGNTINSVAADASFGNSLGTEGWYRILATGYTNGAAVADMSAFGADAWTCHTAAFEITAGGGGGAAGSGALFAGYRNRRVVTTR